jgi:hypothetical protein
MNEQIWKYELGFPKSILLMPKGSEIISIQRQEGAPQSYSDNDEPDDVVLWARVNPEEVKIARTIFIVGTGQNFDPGSASYIGTIQYRGFVWHYFDDDEATWERD